MILHDIWRDRSGRIGLIGAALLLIPALYAPFLANGRPFLLWGGEGVSFPFLRSYFAPDSTERFVEQIFNYAALLLPVWLVLRRRSRLRWRLLAALLVAIPFFCVSPRIDKCDYRELQRAGALHAVWAVIPYGPYEGCAEPYETPGRIHWFGTDAIGRDVGARMIYGARSSLAVGIFGVGIALVIGTMVGMFCGYFRGVADLLTMRLVEILLCFPTFLLLLILMSMLGDRKMEQSVPLVIGVIGFTGWIGLAMLVRGETLKARSLPYVESAVVAGIPARRIMLRHILPNITGPILVSFTFGIAGAILTESSLSFLGFGVQSPTASWGGLLREAFENPLDYWHLTFFPGLALFIAVLAFNFIGEALRRKLAP